MRIAYFSESKRVCETVWTTFTSCSSANLITSESLCLAYGSVSISNVSWLISQSLKIFGKTSAGLPRMTNSLSEEKEIRRQRWKMQFREYILNNLSLAIGQVYPQWDKAITSNLALESFCPNPWVILVRTAICWYQRSQIWQSVGRE